MLPLDAIWINVVAKDFYAARIGHLLAASPSLAPATLFYLLYIFGIVQLVVRPALEKRARAIAAAKNGALFGLVAYATFDLTNQALLKDWPAVVTAADLAWGTALTSVVSAVSFRVAERVSARSSPDAAETRRGK